MAPHSSTLAWKTPWMEELGKLRSMGSLRVGHDLETSLSLFTFAPWRRKWQPTPVFLPGESQGPESLVGCRLWGRTESDMLKRLSSSSSSTESALSLSLRSVCVPPVTTLIQALMTLINNLDLLHRLKSRTLLKSLLWWCTPPPCSLTVSDFSLS